MYGMHFSDSGVGNPYVVPKGDEEYKNAIHSLCGFGIWSYEDI